MTKVKTTRKRKRIAKGISPDRDVGERIIRGLEAICDAMEKGGMAEVERRFTVRRVKIPRPAMTAGEVADLRKSLGASQAVFADLLGVTPNTVRAWEQGINPLSGMSKRFLEAIKDDPEYWRKKLSTNVGNLGK